MLFMKRGKFETDINLDCSVFNRHGGGGGVGGCTATR